RHGQVAGPRPTAGPQPRPGPAAGISRRRAIPPASSDFATAFDAPPGAQLVAYARGPQPVLAYEVTMSGIRADQTPTEMRYIIDAGNGSILAKWDEVHTAKPGRDKSGCSNPIAAEGVGHSLLEGTVALATSNCGNGYELVDQTRGGGSTTKIGRAH